SGLATSKRHGSARSAGQIPPGQERRARHCDNQGASSMSTTVQEPKVQTNDEAILGFVDCDVHPYTKTPADLDAFLPERWRKLRQSIGNRSRAPFVGAPNYPRMSPGVGMR